MTSHDISTDSFSLESFVTFNVSAPSRFSPSQFAKYDGDSVEVIHLSLNTLSPEIQLLARYDNQRSIPLTRSIAKATQSATTSMDVFTTTKWVSATQANAAVFDMPGVGTTSRMLSIGSASSDLLAATSLLLVSGAALALVARKAMFARRAAPAANQNPV